MTKCTEVKKAKSIWKAEMKAVLGNNWKRVAAKNGIYNIPTTEQAKQELIKNLKL
jgi:hypothetical protein